jgi:hypothetical protein
MSILERNIELLKIKMEDSFTITMKNHLLNKNKTIFMKFECKNSRKGMFGNFVYEIIFLGFTLDNVDN